jgi:hypothetical protein
MRRLLPCILLAPAAFAGDPEFFEKKIRPVLVERCYECHGPNLSRPMGGLRLSSKAGLAKGGDSGAAILAGDPDSSRLIRALRYTDPRLQMPPKGKLPNAVIRDFEEWVRTGAMDPRTDDVKESSLKGVDYVRGRKHWAFQPLLQVARPPRGIDGFLLEKLRAKGLSYAPPADRRTLIRRVSLDITGLPPSIDEVEAFVNDRRPDAYERLVDRLLASPHYGERWARHWLDLVRFAETDGHEFDQDKPNAWRYRDYVVRALNSDLAYNQFVREQIAGDLLPQRRVEAGIDQSTVATGFWWLGEIINTPVDTSQALADRTDNQIDVFGKAFLGLTVACARCHDHKFDPIATRDYYSLAGFLHSSRLLQASVEPPDHAAKIRVLLRDDPRRDAVKPTLDGRYEVFEDFRDLARWIPTGLAFGNTPVDGVAHSGRYSAKLTGILISRQFVIKQRYIHVRMAGKGVVRLFADEYTNKGRTFAGSDRMEWKTVDARMGQGNLAHLEISDLETDGYVAVDRIVFSDSKEPPPNEGNPTPVAGANPELDALVADPVYALATADGEPQDLRIYIRGSHHNPGEPAPRRFLPVLAGESQDPVSGSGRLELADRVLRDASHLVARVMVNRLWKHHFGEGLVRTPDNFGLTGDRPTHPELLDYLATRFIEQGWSLKKLHREMLLTQAYQMSSRIDPAAEAADPRNELLHRMPVRRLDAEVLRDQILAVAGTLDKKKMYGPSVTPFVSPYMDGDPRGKPKSGPLDGDNRRSLYIQIRRNYLPDMMLAFDYPQPITTIGRRSVSTVASQALYLLNNEFLHLEARRWAERIMDQESVDINRVKRMYLEAFARPPDAAEVEQSLAFVRGTRSAAPWAELAHILLNTNEFLYVR